jgi:hypothetical protein
MGFVKRQEDQRVRRATQSILRQRLGETFGLIGYSDIYRLVIIAVANVPKEKYIPALPVFSRDLKIGLGDGGDFGTWAGCGVLCLRESDDCSRISDAEASSGICASTLPAYLKAVRIDIHVDDNQ